MWVFNHLLSPACKTCEDEERLIRFNLRHLLMSHVKETAAVCGSDDGGELLKVLWCVRRNGPEFHSSLPGKAKEGISFSHTHNRGRRRSGLVQK